MHRGEEECRACTDFQSFMKQRMTPDTPVTSTQPSLDADQQLKDTRQCPLDRDQLGRQTWSFLHTMAAYYPNKPDAKQQNQMTEFLQLFGQFYPCSECAHDYRQDVAKQPPRVASRLELSEWMCDIHNLTNRKLNKPLFDCSKVLERWRDGWKDGSCG
jgi:FAD-linked sulfhydryl oxidase